MERRNGVVASRKWMMFSLPVTSLLSFFFGSPVDRYRLWLGICIPSTAFVGRRLAVPPFDYVPRWRRRAVNLQLRCDPRGVGQVESNRFPFLRSRFSRSSAMMIRSCSPTMPPLFFFLERKLTAQKEELLGGVSIAPQRIRTSSDD